MPQIFFEGNLEFHFSDAWHILKFDARPEYQRIAQESGPQNLPGTKGVDFLGILDNTLYFIEVKDFRGHRIENRPRLEEGTLAVELAQKVRSSVACMIGFYRTSSTPELWEPFARALATPAKRVKIVLWLEHELPAHPIGRRKAQLSVQLQNFKPRLSWLTPYMLITNQDINNLEHVQVYNRPHPPA